MRLMDTLDRLHASLAYSAARRSRHGRRGRQRAYQPPGHVERLEDKTLLSGITAGLTGDSAEVEDDIEDTLDDAGTRATGAVSSASADFGGTTSAVTSSAAISSTVTQSPGTATGGPGGDEVWLNVSNVLTPGSAAHVDLDKAEDSNSLQLTNFGFDVPENATIDGIEVSLVTTGSDGPRSSTILLTKDGTTVIGTPEGTTGSWAGGSLVAGGLGDVWNTTWTAAEINSSDFGVFIRVEGDANGDLFNVYSAEITVHYTEAPVIDSRANLEQVLQGLEGYHQAFLEFPLDQVPQFRAADGTPHLSWRVHILPFIGYGELYQQFHLDEPWDSPHNLTLLDQMPDVYMTRGLTGGSNVTGFRVLEGNGAFEYSNRIRDAQDGAQHTLLVIETLPQNADFWTRPDGISFDPADPLASFELPSDSFLVGTPNFLVKEINPAVAPETFAAFATWDGDELLTATQYQDLYVDWDIADDATASREKIWYLSRAFSYYHDAYRQYPPGHDIPEDWIDPATGNPYLSWRVHLLPFLGYGDLHAQFRFNEPWDSPHNIQLLDKMPEDFRSRGLTPGGTTSAFKIITGEDAYDLIEFDLGGPRSRDIKDGTTMTLQVVELTPDEAVPWTQWNEIEYSAADPLAGVGPIPEDGLRVSTWNWGTYTINPEVTAENFGLFATWNGSEIFGHAESSNVFLDWTQEDTAKIRARKIRNATIYLQHYHSVYTHFPASGSGSGEHWDAIAQHPNLSWRVHLLPFMGYDALYDQFHLDEPWDSPHNLQLLDKMPEEFRTRGLPADTHLTGMQMFIGGGAYEYDTTSSELYDWRGPRIRDVRDGSQNTIFTIELLPEQAIEWTRPDDISFDPADPLAGVGTIPEDGLLVTTIDGSVHTLNPEVTPENFLKFVTWDGGEIFGPAETLNVFLDWQKGSVGPTEPELGENWFHSRRKLKILGLAMHNYHDTHRSLPITFDPSFWDQVASDENGVPYLSWRVHLLPFLGYGDLYNEFHLDEPWDSPHNIQLLDKMPEEFRSRGLEADSTKTGFQVFMGEGAYEYSSAGTAGIYNLYKGPRLRDINDGTSFTIGIIETLPQDAVEWTRPDGDIAFDPNDPLGSLTLPSDYFHAFMFDGGVSTFNPYLSDEELAAFITFDGGEQTTYPV